MNKLLYLLLIILCWSCTNSSETEKYQNKRDNIINVRERMKEIEMEDVLIGPYARLFLIDDYLIIKDNNSPDELIHIFDKNRFSHVTSTAYKGQGPGEITNIGHIGIDEADRVFFVSDHGKQRIFSYDLDSVLANPSYMPKEKMKMQERYFPGMYQYINDTLSMGLIIEPIGNSGFKQIVAKWNMNTGEIKPMKYEHPEIEKKRVYFAASMENGVYVECCVRHDLMTICSLNGELKYNIYGRNWSLKNPNQIRYYDNVTFLGDKIFALYSGEKAFTEDKRGIRSNCPTKFMVFDTNGDYIQTLETGYHIIDFCYDKENNRIIMSLDDEIQFAYLNLDGLIK